MKKDQPVFPPISDEQLKLLEEFANSRGKRLWKAKLSYLWRYGKISGPLYFLRNTHGPEWLVQFKFPKGGSLASSST